MLKYKTILPGTLELLKKLMAVSVLDNFYLVGGTALALHLGHRISVDLDLFTNSEFDTQQIIHELENNISINKIIGQAKNTLNLVIDNVEVDILRHDYPLIEPISSIDNIRLLSEP